MATRIGGVNLSKNGSFAIIEDGFIDFYLEEERVTRIKRDRSAKATAEKYADGLDAVAIVDCYTKYYPKKFILRTKEKENLCRIFRNKGIKILDYRQRHHECHAANVLFNHLSQMLLSLLWMVRVQCMTTMDLDFVRQKQFLII